jgi:5-methylcytosine-specific restriction endonuclease McrA
VDGERARAVQDVTPATRKFVVARDKHRCRVPGCRSARNIEVHHIVHREHGGSHEPNNLVCLCSGHHDAHHEVG